MSGKMALVALAVTTTTVVLGAPSAAWAGYDYDREGPRVVPCSLTGVNPAYHPGFLAIRPSPKRIMVSSKGGTALGT